MQLDVRLSLSLSHPLALSLPLSLSLPLFLTNILLLTPQVEDHSGHDWMADSKQSNREGDVGNDRVKGHGGDQSQLQWLGATLVQY